MGITYDSVAKPNRKLRICVTYRWLNAKTKQIQIYMPMLEELLDHV